MTKRKSPVRRLRPFRISENEIPEYIREELDEYRAIERLKRRVINVIKRSIIYFVVIAQGTVMIHFAIKFW